MTRPGGNAQCSAVAQPNCRSLTPTKAGWFPTLLICKKSRVKNVRSELYAIVVLSLPRPGYSTRNVARDGLNVVMRTKKVLSICRQKDEEKKSSDSPFPVSAINPHSSKDTFKTAPFSPIATVPNQSADPICNPPGPTPSHVTTRSHARKRHFIYSGNVDSVESKVCGRVFWEEGTKWADWLGDQRKSPEKWRGRRSGGQGRKREHRRTHVRIKAAFITADRYKTSLAHSCRTTV